MDEEKRGQYEIEKNEDEGQEEGHKKIEGKMDEPEMGK